mgnify:FL=1
MFYKKYINKLTALLILGMFCVQTQVSAETEVRLIEIYPSDSEAFTQGFELSPDTKDLILATGLYGKSSIGLLDLETGEYSIKANLSEEYFGEGITIVDDFIWQLTWKEGKAFKRDLASFEIVDEQSYQGEGWGIAYDAEADVIWMSDGTSVLQQRNPQDFTKMAELEVTYNGQPVVNLNELEFANDLIYANIWYSDKIIAINPSNGEIEYVYDFGELLQRVDNEIADELVDQKDVLNGIAHIEGNQFYITGKLYPYVLEVELNR